MKLILTTAFLSACLFVAAPQPVSLAAQPVAATSAPRVFSSPQKEGTKATCPVTGEAFVIAKDTVHATHKGKHVYFCCPGCKKSFDKDPDKYTK